jgi:tetratricopeptide (TPR) repeat protein
MFRVPVLSLIFLFSISATGTDSISLKKIDTHYESAQDSHKGLLQTESMILKAQDSAGTSEPLAWRLARTYYSLAGVSRKEAAKEYYSRCLETAGQTIDLDSKSAWGFYLRGLCRGKLGEMQGLWSSLSMIRPLKKDFQNAVRLDPAVSEGGPHRALGKLYLELPGLLGGNVDKSVDHLKQAVRLGPKFADNYLFLADALSEQENYRAAQKTLQDLLTMVAASNDLSDDHEIRKKVMLKMTEIDSWIASQP